MGYRKHRHDALLLVDPVQDPVVTAPRRPHLIKRPVQRLTQPVRVLGHGTGHVLEDRGRRWKRELVQVATSSRRKKIA